jgi:hypothetical protein
MRLVACLGLLAVLTAAVPSVHAQSTQRMATERVRFARGESSATYARTVDAGRSVRYLVSVRAGQTMTVDLQNYGEDGGAYVQVYAPGRSIIDRNAAPSSDGARQDLVTWTGRLSRAGDYQIVVYPAPGARSAVYELTVAAR